MTQITLPDETVEIPKVLKELAKLAEARKILDEIWSHFGPYAYQEPMPDEIITKLRGYYDFDDSE